MGKSFKIREAKPDDIHDIENLCRQLGYDVERCALQRRLDQIANDSDQLLRVATNKHSGVLGWVHALPVCYLEADTFIEIGGLVVDSSNRRLGIGQALMAAVEDWAREGGFTTIRLRSNAKRTEAHEFYRRFDYEVVKQQIVFVKELR